MADKKKKAKIKTADVSQAYWEMVNLKINETKGMYIGSDDAANAANAVAALYNKGMDIEIRKKEAAINLGKAVAGVVGMTIETVMYERDVNTCLGLEQAYHSGAVEIKNLRKDFKPRRLLEK